MNYYGGDLRGLIEVIESLFRFTFDKYPMAFPIIQNPEGAFGLWDQGGVRSTFSGYQDTGQSHCLESTIMGTEEDLKELLEAAHAKEMNILLDYVANHASRTFCDGTIS